MRSIRPALQQGSDLEHRVRSPQFWLGLVGVVVVIWKRLWLAIPVIVWGVVEAIMLFEQQPLLEHHIVLSRRRSRCLPGFVCRCCGSELRTRIHLSAQQARIRPLLLRTGRDTGGG